MAEMGFASAHPARPNWSRSRASSSRSALRAARHSSQESVFAPSMKTLLRYRRSTIQAHGSPGRRQSMRSSQGRTGGRRPDSVNDFFQASSRVPVRLATARAKSEVAPVFQNETARRAEACLQDARQSATIVHKPLKGKKN